MANAKRKSSAAPVSTGAPSKVSNETFTVGQRVILNNGTTGNKDVEAVVEKYAAGWYVLKLLATGKTQSARAGSLTAQRTAAPVAVKETDDDENIDGEDFFQTNRDAPLPYEPDAPDAGETDDDAEDDLDALDAALTVAQRMAEALRKARSRYQKTHRPMGGASADCGDQIAKELREYEPDEVARLADAVLGVAAGTHFAKYGHLNNGQIRMNSGNRIRAYYKQIAEQAAKEEKEAIEELARLNKLLNLVEDEELADEEDRGPEGDEPEGGQ